MLMSTTSKRLQSKYEPSARKIQQLYQEFSNIKRNCVAESKVTKVSEQIISSLPKKDFGPFEFANEVSYSKHMKIKQTEHPNDGIGLSFQNEKLVTQAMLKSLNQLISKFNETLLNKIEAMESKLSQIVAMKSDQEIIKQSMGVQKQKKFCSCKQKRRFSFNNIIEIEQIYQKYENKLQSSGTQQTLDSECLRKSQTKFQQEIEMLELKLVSKEQNILELQEQNRKLQKIGNQYKDVISQKQTMIKLLSKEVEEKSSKLEEIAKLKVQIILTDPFNFSSCEDCESLQKEIKELKKKQVKKGQKQKIRMIFDSFFDMGQEAQTSKVERNQRIQPNKQTFNEFDRIQLANSQEQDDENLQPKKQLANN